MQCKVCREDIKLGAKKCTHCNSYQDWRRLVAVSSSVLALLVALVSVISTTLPHLSEIFVEEFSNVNIQAHSIKSQYIEVVAYNSGNKEAFFNTATLSAEDVPPIKLEEYGFSYPIPPSASRSVLVFVPLQDTERFFQWKSKGISNAKLEFVVNNYDTSKYVKNLTVKNDMFSSLMINTKEAVRQYNLTNLR